MLIFYKLAIFLGLQLLAKIIFWEIDTIIGLPQVSFDQHYIIIEASDIGRVRAAYHIGSGFLEMVLLTNLPAANSAEEIGGAGSPIYCVVEIYLYNTVMEIISWKSIVNVLFLSGRGCGE